MQTGPGRNIAHLEDLILALDLERGRAGAAVVALGPGHLLQELAHHRTCRCHAVRRPPCATRLTDRVVPQHQGIACAQQWGRGLQGLPLLIFALLLLGAAVAATVDVGQGQGFLEAPRRNQVQPLRVLRHLQAGQGTRHSHHPVTQAFGNSIRGPRSQRLLASQENAAEVLRFQPRDCPD